MYRIKKLTNCGNIDFDQNPYEVKYGTKTLVDIKHKKLSKLRDLINVYIDEYDLGGGNFIPPKVYKNKKYVGYFSYNARFWREKYPHSHLEKEYNLWHNKQKEQYE